MTITATSRSGASVATGNDPTSPSFTSINNSRLIAIVATYNADDQWGANGDVTDSKSNSWVCVTKTTRTAANQVHVGIWEQVGGTRGTSHTVTYTTHALETANIGVLELEWTGTALTFDTTTDAEAADTSSPFSVTAAAAISGTQVSIGGCVLDTGGTNAWTQPSGYTNIFEESNGASLLVSNCCYKVNETGTPTLSWSNSDTTSAARELVATWKETPPSGADVRSVSTAAGGASGSCTIPKPANIVAGDVLLGIIVHGTASAMTWTPGSGFTEVAHNVNAFGSVGFFKKEATGSEPADYTFSSSVSNDVWGTIIAIQGGDYSALETGSATNGASGGTVNPTLTTTATGCLVGLAGADATASASGGRTASGDLVTADEDTDQYSATFTDAWVAIYSKPSVTAGSKSVTVTDSDTSSDPSGILFLVPDASTAPTASGPLGGLGATATATVTTVNPYVVETKAAASSGRSPSLTFDTPPLENDIVIMWPSSTTLAAITVPNGWVNVLGGTTIVQSDAHALCCVYHIVTAAEAGASTVTFSPANLWDASETGDVVGCVVRKVKTTDVLAGTNSAFNSGNSTTPHVLAGLTPDESDGLVLSSVAKDGAGTYTNPTGWTQLIQSNNNQGRYLGRYNTLSVASTPIADTNITPSAGDEYASITVVLAKAPVAATIEGTASGPLGGLTGAASATIHTPVQATASGPLGGLTGTAIATIVVTIQATASGPLGGLTGTASATVTVGKTLDARWDVRTALGDSSDVRWDVRAALGDSGDIRWAVRTTLNDSSDIRWKVEMGGDQLRRWSYVTWQTKALPISTDAMPITTRAERMWATGMLPEWAPVAQAVGKQFDYRWSIRTSLGDNFDVRWQTKQYQFALNDVRWGVRTTFNDSNDLRWRITTTVGDQSEFEWAVRSFVGDQSDVRWQVKAPVGDTNDLRWSIRVPFNDSSDLRWALRALVNDSPDLRWSVRMYISDDSDVRWAIRTFLGDSSNIQWTVRGLVGDSSDLRWNTRAAVGDSNDLRWTVVGPVGLTLDVRWGVRTWIHDTSDFRWGVRSPVSDSAELIWNIRAALSDVNDLRWDIRSLFADSSDIRWGIRVPFNDSSDLRWALRAPIGDNNNLQWNVKAPLADNLSLIWNVLQIGVVGDNVNLQWNTRVALGDQSDLRWKVWGYVNKNTDLRWALKALVPDNADLRWNVRVNFYDSLSLIWDLGGPIGDTIGLVWRLRENIPQQKDLRWRTAQMVPQQRDLQWNVKKIVGDQIWPLWSLRQLAGDSIENLWGIRTFISDQFELQWVLKFLAGDSTNLQWNLKALFADNTDLRWRIFSNLQTLVLVIALSDHELLHIRLYDYKLMDIEPETDSSLVIVTRTR